MKIKYLILIILIIQNLSTFSQTTRVTGNIYTDSIPVRNVSITFTETDDPQKYFSAITDTAGYYQLDITTGIREEPIIPQSIELAQNYPNPFSYETEIPYKLSKESDVSIRIYNILGQEVKAYCIGLQAIGVHGVRWDGTNNSGNRVSQGIYFYQLQTSNEILVKKMVFTRGNASINIPIIGKSYSNCLELEEKETIPLPLTTYSVQIVNTDSTTPKILFSEFSNIIIQNDTTLNFQVQAEEWKCLGLENETVTAIAIDSIDPNIIYAGTTDDFSAGIYGKLFKSIDGGINWDTLLFGGKYRSIIIDPTNHNVVYAVWGGIVKSYDGGETWQNSMDGIYIDYETRVQSLAMNPKNPNVLYAGTGGFFGGTMYKSYDGGLQWNEIGSDSLSDGVFSIAIDPIDTNNVYAGTAFRGILWKSTDAGTTWFRTGLGETGVHNIFIDPQTPTILYVGVPFLGIFKTENAGINWEKINMGLPNNCSVMNILKSSSSQLFIVETFNDEGGIYEYSFSQNQWMRIGINALNVSYYYSDLKISSNSNKLYFGGAGGVYVLDLKE